MCSRKLCYLKFHSINSKRYHLNRKNTKNRISCLEIQRMDPHAEQLSNLEWIRKFFPKTKVVPANFLGVFA